MSWMTVKKTDGLMHYRRADGHGLACCDAWVRYAHGELSYVSAIYAQRGCIGGSTTERADVTCPDCRAATVFASDEPQGEAFVIRYFGWPVGASVVARFESGQVRRGIVESVRLMRGRTDYFVMWHEGGAHFFEHMVEFEGEQQRLF